MRICTDFKWSKDKMMGELSPRTRIEAKYPMKKGSKHGYIDKRGQWIVEPKFDMAYRFIENNALAIVSLNGRHGFIDRRGRIAIDIRFEEVSDFEVDGTARAMERGKWGCINADGEWTVKPKFARIGVFSANDLAVAEVKNKDTKGYIDRSGNWAIRPKFGKAWEFNKDNLARVTIKTGVGVIDSAGNWVIKPLFDHIDFEHDLIWLEAGGREGSISGYATKKGQYITFTEGDMKRIRRGP